MDTAHQKEAHQPKHVAVTVTYVGDKPYHHSFPVEDTLKDVKLGAMKKFEIEASAADKYQLMLGDSALPDDRRLETLGVKKVEFELRLKNEVPKG